MNLLLFMTFLILNTSTAIRLKSSDYCKSISQECKTLAKKEYRFYNSQHCDLKCVGRLSYECQNSYCATNKEACDSLMPNTSLIKELRNPREYNAQMRTCL